MSGDDPITPAQKRFALDLIRNGEGIGRAETCDRNLARRLGLPQAETVEDAVGSLSKAEASKLIDSLKED